MGSKKCFTLQSDRCLLVVDEMFYFLMESKPGLFAKNYLETCPLFLAIVKFASGKITEKRLAYNIDSEKFPSRFLAKGKSFNQ